jgi:hypothetical protein
MTAKPVLTQEILLKEARAFATKESSHKEPSIFGATDGKAVGTYVEQKFREYLADRYVFPKGNSAKGIDFPELNIDTKVTSIKQPQSSCPYKSARQKIFGLGYSLIIFVYEKRDDAATKTATLNFVHTIFVDESRTGDYQMTTGLIKILENNANQDDLVAFMMEKNLPVDEIEAAKIADDLLKKPPNVGYLTISNALQWRLQYTRVIDCAGKTAGILRIV